METTAAQAIGDLWEVDVAAYEECTAVEVSESVEGKQI